MNLLPGLRELRAPLAAGYIWLIALWLGLDHAGWLPAKRPQGNGEVARLWDLGGTLGKTVLLATVTFIAYLIGSFLQMRPDGPVARLFEPLILARREPSYLHYIPAARGRFTPEGLTSMRVARAMSWETRWSLLELLQVRDAIVGLDQVFAFDKQPANQASAKPANEQTGHRTSLLEHILQVTRDLQQWLSNDFGERRKHDAWLRDLTNQRQSEVASLELEGDERISLIIEEMPQLASQLLVKNKELYGKYNRLMAEADIRMNMSIPLAVLFILATGLSDLPIWLRPVLIIASATFGFMLLRQGFLRAVSARDVIVQALAIGELESRHMRPEASRQYDHGSLEGGFAATDVEPVSGIDR